MIISREPLAGIITRTKDRTLFLRRAIESVLGQTYENWTMVIVNDGGEEAPVDALVEAYAPQAHGRIRVIHNPVSLGMNGASKKGLDSIQEAGLLAIHDDDDSWAPDFLYTCATELRRAQEQFPNTQGITTYSRRILETVRATDAGEAIQTDAEDPFNGWIPEGFLSFDQVLAANPIPTISFVFTAYAFRELGCLYEALPILGDWEFLVRLMSRFDVWVVPKYLAFYHHRSTMSGAHGNSVIAGVEQHKFWRQYQMNQWLREDLAAGKFGVGAYAHMRQHLETLLAASGTSARDADPDVAQSVVNYYWDSPSWRALKPVRTLAEQVFKLPKAERPSAASMKEAWSVARDVQESVSWNVTAPLRLLEAWGKIWRKAREKT